MGEVLRRCLSGAFSKAIGGVGTVGRGRGLTHGAGGKGLPPGGRAWDPGAWERRPLPPWRHGPVFHRSPLALAGLRFFSPPAGAETSIRPGGDWGRERLPLRAAPFCAPRTKASKLFWVGHPGSARVGGHRLGHEGAASWSRQGRGKRPSCVCWRARAGRAPGLKLPVAAATCPPHLGKNNNALSRACVYVCGT